MGSCWASLARASAHGPPRPVDFVDLDDAAELAVGIAFEHDLQELVLEAPGGSDRKPTLLILDELGYLRIDKTGGNLLFQIISQRYEQGGIIVTSNRAYNARGGNLQQRCRPRHGIPRPPPPPRRDRGHRRANYRMKDRIE